jgi:hypothetical protein
VPLLLPSDFYFLARSKKDEDVVDPGSSEGGLFGWLDTEEDVSR